MSYIKKFGILLYILGIAIMPAESQTVLLDSLYDEMDNAIAHHDDYLNKRIERIDQLKSSLSETSNEVQRYELLRKIVDEYIPYRIDSTLIYLNECINTAASIGNASWKGECMSLMARNCSNSGMYDEARTILSEIDTTSLTRRGLYEYLAARNHLYGELSYYSNLPRMRELYQQLASDYEKKMDEVADKHEQSYMVRKEMGLLYSNKLDESMAFNDKWMKEVEKGSHPYALVALYRYLEYQARKDTVEMQHWLLESALADVRNGVMDQGSMWELSNLLMAIGDDDRAFRYISFTSDCARRYGSRLRNWRSAPLLSRLSQINEEHNTESRHRMIMFLTITLALLLGLFGALLYVLRQRRKLRATRDDLHASNARLSQVNEQLKQSNARLTELNGRNIQANGELKALNGELYEVSKMKDEYVGRFMRLCSIYLDKMESQRKRVNKMVKQKEYDKLYEMTKPSENQSKEMDELLELFDSAFLQLFPDFVSDFNALLRPEERIELSEPTKLNTSLRIFALIRLGIEDSGKIADFLHYSVNTIYNYRARIKNGALEDRDNFEQHVKEIGMPS